MKTIFTGLHLTHNVWLKRKFVRATAENARRKRHAQQHISTCVIPFYSQNDTERFNIEFEWLFVYRRLQKENPTKKTPWMCVIYESSKCDSDGLVDIWVIYFGRVSTPSASKARQLQGGTEWESGKKEIKQSKNTVLHLCFFFCQRSRVFCYLHAGVWM